MSPTTLMTNALRDAATADGRSVIEADQQVRREADEAPADEQSDEVVGEHEREHREHEEVQVGEEARERVLAGHVADRVDVDQEADAGDDHRPDQRDAIPLQAERELRQPRDQRLMRADGAAASSHRSTTPAPR